MSVFTAVLIGLAMGMVFGLALEKSRVFEPGVIVGQMQLRNFIMLKVFLTASLEERARRRHKQAAYGRVVCGVEHAHGNIIPVELLAPTHDLPDVFQHLVYVPYVCVQLLDL